MQISSLLRRESLLVAAAFQLCTWNTQAFTISLQEQGALTGSIVGGGGAVIITPLGTDHWSVNVQDPRIVTALSPPFNNLQVLLTSPEPITFDVLSDEFSPYSTTVQNGGTAPFQNTDIQMVSVMFTDFADSVPEPGSFGLLAVGSVLILLKRTRPRS